MVPGARLELARIIHPRDFKSLVSTDSTTRALYFYVIWRRVPESNRDPRICNPLHSHSANAPEDGYSYLLLNQYVNLDNIT